MSTAITPLRLAAAARALQPTLFEALAMSADTIARELADRFLMVEWDRVRLIGQAQRGLLRLVDRRFPIESLGGPPAHVVERRALPLECIETAWSQLRMGRRVYLTSEPGACESSVDLMRRMAEILGHGQLTLEPPAGDDRDATVVEPAWAGPRVALVQPDADLETAAYVLARTCLRRAGFDPRAVHRVLVAAPMPRLRRVLGRLWVGARMGPVEDPTAFAGPVSADAANAYLAATKSWAEHPGVETVVEGGELRRPEADEHRRFVAPALFVLERAETAPAPVAVGPMLILEPVEPQDAERRLRETAPASRNCTVVRFGEAVRGIELNEFDRQVRGALLVERLPPGLPDPRP